MVGVQYNMITLLLEIINPNSHNTGFYNPAIDGAKAYPRTVNGAKSSIKKMKKIALSMEYVSDFRIACYNGQKQYWNDRPLLGYISKEVILRDF